MAEANLWAVVLSGITGAVLTQGVTILRDTTGKKEEGRVTALLLALTLEEYASRCAHYHIDNSTWSGQVDDRHADVPTLAEFSDKTNWRALGVPLSSKVLQLRVSHTNARNWVSTEQQHGYQQVVDAAEVKCLELGLEALTAAEDLRAGHKLEARPVEGEWSLRDYLHNEKAKLDRRRAYWKARMESGEEFVID